MKEKLTPRCGNWRRGGFRDMSRLAGQDVQMMGDVVSTNTQAVATLLALFRMQLAMLEASAYFTG